ncbi:DUF4132 domain-containing protein [Gloeocapsopsis crepidinum LEGE 06123]|uniref:DUF4132 domain-containing protein n=1 Tax=Gloeocapsopsis crepidinum LEGE 06123 TaxID=588587 RepID=A0ABR9UTH5_9CHRO|nr:DUF4132 domain-containing protein [Gloeocapsopsis crepidinum]MBE9191559.1 DUF4132 domain-containing protein [Gloeocapsopsis crepidinum LEGE 06123]
MEIPTSLQERVTLFEREISRLFVDVWQIDQIKNYQHLSTQQGIYELLFRDEMATLRNAEIMNIPSGQIVFGWSVPHNFGQLSILVQRSLEQLATHLPITELGNLAADTYFNPMLWQSCYIINVPQYQAVVEILTACLIEFTPFDMCDRLANRLTQILANPFYTNEVEIKQRQRICYVPDLYLTPTLEDCLALLLKLPPSSQNIHLVEQLVLGKWDFGPFDPSGYFGKMYYTPQGFPCYNDDAKSQQQQWQFNFDAYAYPYDFDSCKSIRAYQIYGRGFYTQSNKGLCYYFPHLMNRLHEYGRFGYTEFCQAVQHLPLIFHDACELMADGVVTPFHAQLSDQFSRVILEYCDKLVGETAQNLSKENYYILTRIKKLQGSHYLLEAVRQHSIYQIGKLVYPHANKYFRNPNKIKWQDGITRAVINLAQAADTEPELPTDRQVLIAQLQRLPFTSLKYLLPIAQNSQNVLCVALGWDEALPLINILKIVKHNITDTFKVELDLKTVATLRSAFVKAGDLGREIWTLWREAKVFDKNTVFLIEAIAGWNRTEIEQALAQRKQLAIKAYGLLPLEGGQEEVLERYLFLQQFLKESKKFGAEKQANEQIAVQQALAYLAQVAGYPNAQRLESMMEAHFNQKIAPETCHWSIGEYQVTIALKQADVQLSVRRGDQLLKSVPTVVRQSQIYTEIKATVQQLRNQMTRFRRHFEEIMATGQPLSYEELTVFSQIPIARKMLNQLVLLTEQSCGLFVTDALAVQGLDGKLIPLQNQSYIAHPYHFFHKGELAAWQQEIFRQRLVQPFKQVFRELYLVTPAEQETYNYSYRFAGHKLESRVVARLLQSRGWQLGYGEYPIPFKVFPELDLVAYFEFQDASYYLSASEEITSDRIYFQADQFIDGTLLPLIDIPPIIFSEVMRDADLVVTVAQREGETHLSQETYQRHGDLIRTLIADLGLANVTVAGHFAQVQGKLACYQVHLASAAIHIKPGHYLCIVPDRWENDRNFFCLLAMVAIQRSARLSVRFYYWQMMTKSKIKVFYIRFR